MIPVAHPHAPALFTDAPIKHKFDARLAELLDLPRKTLEPHYMASMPNDIRGVMQSLYEGFNSKCPFCECALPLVREEKLPFVLFRPAENAAQAHGDNASNSHYWWLVWEWRNFYPSCDACMFRRGTYFPVAGKRATPSKRPARALAAEGAFIIDPCEDDPHAHLSFDEAGNVSGATARGEITIDAFGLDREDLVKRRAAEAGLFRALWNECGAQLVKAETDIQREGLINTLLQACDDRVVFAGMKRQLLRDWSNSLTDALSGGAGAPGPATPQIRLPASVLVDKSIVLYVQGDLVVGDKTEVNTQGGAYIAGQLTVKGDFAARDKIVNTVFGRLAQGRKR
jgi:hypothetical protein